MSASEPSRTMGARGTEVPAVLVPRNVSPLGRRIVGVPANRLLLAVVVLYTVHFDPPEESIPDTGVVVEIAPDPAAGTVLALKK